MAKTTKAKAKSSTTKPKSDYVKLTDYIAEIWDKYDSEPPWSLLMTQVKKMIKDYNLTYKEILHILQYMTTIKGINVAEKDTLGLVPYYIDETQAYIQRYKDVKKMQKEFEYEETVVSVPNRSNVTFRTVKKNETF